MALLYRLFPYRMNRGVDFELLEWEAIWPKYKYSVETFPLIAIEDIGERGDRHEVESGFIKLGRNHMTGAPEAVTHALSTSNGRNGIYFYDRRGFWNCIKSREPSDYAPGSRSVLIVKKQENGKYDVDLAPDDLFVGNVFTAGTIDEPHIQRVSKGTTPLHNGDFGGLTTESPGNYITRELWKTDWYKNFDAAPQPIPDPYTGFYKSDSWSIPLAYGGSNPNDLTQAATSDLRIHSTINSTYLLGWRYSGGALSKFGAWRGAEGGPGPLIRGGYGMTGTLGPGDEARSTPQQAKMVETGWQYNANTSIGANWGSNVSPNKPYQIRFDAMGTMYTSEVIKGRSQSFNALPSQPITAFFGLGVNRELWQSSQNGLTVLMSAWQHGRSWAWRFRGEEGDLPLYVDADPPQGRLDRSITGVDGPWQNYGYMDGDQNIVVVYQRDENGALNKYVKDLGKIPIDIADGTAEVIGGFPDLYNNHVVFIVRGYNTEYGWFVGGVVDKNPGGGDSDNVQVVTPQEQTDGVCVNGKIKLGPIYVGYDAGYEPQPSMQVYFRILNNDEPMTEDEFRTKYIAGVFANDNLNSFISMGAYSQDHVSGIGTKRLGNGWWVNTSASSGTAGVGDKVMFKLWRQDHEQDFDTVKNSADLLCTLKTNVLRGFPPPPSNIYDPLCKSGKVEFGPVAAGLDLDKPNDYGFGTVKVYFRIIKNGEPITKDHFENNYFVTIEPPKTRSGAFGMSPISGAALREQSRGWWKYMAAAGSGARIGDVIKISIWEDGASNPFCTLRTIVQNGDPVKPDLPGAQGPSRPPKSYYKPYQLVTARPRATDERTGKVDNW